MQVSAAPSGLLLRPLGDAPARSAAPQRAEAPSERVAGPVVRIEDAAFSYGSRVVFDGLRHVFAPGRLHLVAGPSGTGKTTLLLMLAALERPDRGRILCDDLDVTRLDVERAAAWRRRAVGYLNQHTLIAGHLTALENAHWLGATVVASAHDPDLIEAADAVLDLGR